MSIKSFQELGELWKKFKENTAPKEPKNDKQN